MAKAHRAACAGLFGSALFVLSAIATGAATYTVRPDGSGDFANIQAAISGASDGDVIELDNGIYTGDGNRDVDFLGKAVTVRSRNGFPQACIIDCQGEAGAPHRGFLFLSNEGPDSRLEGVTIRGGFIDEDMGGALACIDASPSLTRVVCHGNATGWVAGALVCMYAGGAPTLTECVFSSNQTTSHGGAVYAHGGAEPTFIRCTFLDNVAGQAGGGIRGVFGARITLQECVFARNDGGLFGGAVAIGESSALLTENCTFTCNRAADGSTLYACDNSDVSLRNAILAFGTGGPAFECEADTWLRVVCCDVYGHAAGNWTDCLAGLHGVYGNFSADPLFCDPAHDDYHLLPGSPCTPEHSGGCGLVGALPAGCRPPRTWYVTPEGLGDAPTVAAGIDSAIVGDTVLVAGGTFQEHDLMLEEEITLRGESGDPNDVTLDAGGLSAVLFCSGVSPGARIEALTFTGGINSGVACQEASPSFTDCVIAGNQSSAYGGGVFCRDDSSPQFLRCEFRGNRVSGDGGMGGALFCTYGSRPRFRECIFRDNQAAFGGAICGVMLGGAMMLSNCTLVRNAATSLGGGLYLIDAAATVDNSIIALGNPGAAAICGTGGSVEASCCDVYGNAGGDWLGCLLYQLGENGNVQEDPLFCDITGNDFHLHADSPCAPENSGGCGLIGALQVGCGSSDVALADPPAGGVRLDACRPNPSAAGTTLHFALPCRLPVRLGIVDVSGRLVRDLASGCRSAGEHHLLWDGQDEAGASVPPGVYFCRLEAGHEVRTQQLVLLR